jgi:hypothetical protein
MQKNAKDLLSQAEAEIFFISFFPHPESDLNFQNLFLDIC